MSADGEAFWSYTDALIVIGLSLPVLIAAHFIAVGLISVSGVTADKDALTAICGQAASWGLMAVAATALFQYNYERPLLASLGFVRWRGRPRASLLLGQGLALTISLLAAASGMSTGDSDRGPLGLAMTSNTFWLLALLGTTLLPFAEEALFRGFFQPLTVRTFGTAIGIALPGLLYVLTLMPGYNWSWRHGMALTIASLTFGWIRYRTKSTTAAALVHCAYNATFWMLLVLIPVFRSGAGHPK